MHNHRISGHGAGRLAALGRCLRAALPLFVCLLPLLRVEVADAREVVLKATAREYQVEATLARYPFTLGDNHIEFSIRDGAGRSVSDATVLVNYYMPPMPRMVPMNYKIEARPEHERYAATLNIIMAGPWYVKLIITRAGKIATARFNVDAQ